MNRILQAVVIVSAACVVLLLADLAASAAKKRGREFAVHYWEDPYHCVGCHWERYADWSSAQMSRAYTGDFFQAQYFQYALPDSKRDPKMKVVAADCIGCHSPTALLSDQIPPPPSRMKDNYWNRAWPWLDSFLALGQLKTGLQDERLEPLPDRKYRNTIAAAKHNADRGVFCDFCHSIENIADRQPFNHNYISDARPGRNTKRADLEFPWSPYHDTQVSELFETADLCGICHNEKNPLGVWVKATHRECSDTMYAERDIVCQHCHMPPRQSKPAKMGPVRDWNHGHWFGGGFTGFVEGAAKVRLCFHEGNVGAGTTVPLQITVGDIATGHLFPTGATEERDVWLHVAVYDRQGNELQHIPVPPNPADPNDRYFITSNRLEAYPSHSSYSKAIARDALPEGNRIYQDVFLDSNGNVIFGQWYAVRIIGNCLEPGETRTEKYFWKVPQDLAGKQVYLRATLWYRRMADSHAEVLGIDKRPHLLVSQDEKIVQIAAH